MRGSTSIKTLVEAASLVECARRGLPGNLPFSYRCAESAQAGLLGIPSPKERSRETWKERSSQYGAADYRSRAADQRVLSQSLAAGWRQIPSPRRMLPAGRALLSLRLLSQAPRVG